MPVIWTDGFVKVGTTFLRKKLYVKSLKDGRVVYADAENGFKLAEIFQEIDRTRFSLEERNFAIGYAASRFAMSCLAPNTIASRMFLDTKPGEFIAICTVALRADGPPFVETDVH